LEQKSLTTKKLFTNVSLFKLFIPLIIEQFLEYLVGLADSIMVSSVGESAVSGLSESATALTKQNVWSHGIVMVLIWPLAYTLPVTFRASGDAKFPMIVGVLSMFFCRIALAYLLSIYFNMGMFGTWVAMFIDWIVKAIIFVWPYMSGRWTKFHAI